MGYLRLLFNNFLRLFFNVKFCEYCGSWLRKDEVRCSDCGSLVRGSDVKSLGLFTVGLMFFPAGLIISIVCLAKKKKKKAKSAFLGSLCSLGLCAVLGAVALMQFGII